MINKQTHYSLLLHNTFGIDVQADLFYEYNTVEELKQILSSAAFFAKPFLPIGAGSNLLFTSSYAGSILHSQIKSVELVKETDESVWIRVGSGVEWDAFVAHCVEQGWGGAENLSLIPGEVGATAVQNIGAYGVEAGDLIDSVEIVELPSLNENVLSNADCRFSYRQSVFKNEYKGKCIVTYVTYRLSKQPLFHLGYGNVGIELANYAEVNLATIRQAIIAIRERKLPDPKVLGNAGSFFMNPVIPRWQFERLQKKYADVPHYEVNAEQVKVPAAWMIEQSGWKGKSLGRAAVHQNQALVLINKGGATGQEIIALAQAVQESVKKMFGVDIHPEVNFISEK